MEKRRNPAVAAGLAGTFAWAVPATAHAASLADTLDSAFVSPSYAFIAGAAAGAGAAAAIVGLVSFLGSRLSRDGYEADAVPADVPVIERAGQHFKPAAEVETDLRDAPASWEPADHAASDYEQIAENYAKRQASRERSAARKSGVAATLMARMGAGKMDGVPVISRADGTVGDVGTSWWTAAVGEENIKQLSDLAASGSLGETVLSVPADYSLEYPAVKQAPAQMPAQAPVQMPAQAPARPASRIADRVAFVDEGVYPELRTVDDLAKADEWEQALRSLDERLAGDAAHMPAFADTVGGIDTLDEPDNLEPNTQFIPFKAPAGHPEVKDTDSYVDYLIASEFDKSPSTAARASSRRFLTVIEGGSQKLERAYTPKHFAMPVAAEA